MATKSGADRCWPGTLYPAQGLADDRNIKAALWVRPCKVQGSFPDRARCLTSRLFCHQVLLAAVHPFDTHGAKAAGLQAAFIDRSGEQEYPPYYLPPDVTVRSIPELVDYLERLE